MPVESAPYGAKKAPQRPLPQFLTSSSVTSGQLRLTTSVYYSGEEVWSAAQTSEHLRGGSALASPPPKLFCVALISGDFFSRKVQEDMRGKHASVIPPLPESVSEIVSMC